MKDERTQPDLVAALRAEQCALWRQGERPPVEAYLVKHPGLTNSADGVLELVYNEVLLREERGESPDLDEYQQRFPWLAADLVPLFELHRGLAVTSLFPAAEEPPEEKKVVPISGPPVLPGYQILKELGRGGMGVVYLARQLKLNRLVALKMILAGSHAGPEALPRLRKEAATLARLDHPNLVKIYDVDEHEGQPFLTLEFVNGGSLAQQLTGTPHPVHTAARLIEILARAIQCAHRQGIIHRDLKPANILLQKNSTTDNTENTVKINQGSSSSELSVFSVVEFSPKITDFGLAKRIEGEGEGEGTESGRLVGSPCYMPPEQARGERTAIGPAADVYGLGAILYELLTGRPPFRGETIWATVEQVVALEPVSPGQLRPGLARDLETICLKCLQKDPRKRYASAEELAEDLRRYLAGEPIRARPVKIWEKAGKWVRRRPAVAALLALSGTVVLALLGLSLWTSVTLHELNWKLQEKTAHVERSQEEAQASLDDALELAQSLLKRDNDQVEDAETERHWQRLLEKVVDGYERILSRNSVNPLVSFRAGRAYARLGAALHLRGDTAAGEKAYRRALALQSALVEQFPDNPDYRNDLAATWNGLGNLRRFVGPPREAIEAFREAIWHQEQLARQQPAVAVYQHNLARYYQNLAHRIRDPNGHDQARELYHKAQLLEAALSQRHPGVTEYKFAWAMALHDRGHMVADTDLGAAVRMCEQAAAAVGKILAEHPSPIPPAYQHGLAEIDHNLPKLLIALARREAAQKHHDKAQQLLAAAQQRFDRALDVHRALADRFPQVPRYGRELARHHLNRGQFLANDLNQPQQAVPDLQQALNYFTKVGDFPSPYLHQLELGQVKSTLGHVLLATSEETVIPGVVFDPPVTPQQERDQGLALLDEATGHFHAVLQLEPDNDKVRQRLVRDYRALARAWLQRGRGTAAAAAAANLAQASPNSPADHYEAARLLAACVPLASAEPDATPETIRQRADSWAKQAVALLRQVVRQEYRTITQIARDPAFAQPLQSCAAFRELVAGRKR